MISSAVWLLFVENDDIFASTATKMLRGLKVRVERAVTIAEAGALLGNDHPLPALVVLDLGLPDGDGANLIPVIRQLDPLLPIIVLSGAMSLVREFEFMRAGIPAFFKGRGEPRDFRELVTSILQGSRSAMEKRLEPPSSTSRNVASLRQTAPAGGNLLTCIRNTSIDADFSRLIGSFEQVELTRTQHRILNALCEADGDWCSAENLARDALDRTDPGGPGSIYKHVARLCERLRIAGVEQAIESNRQRGYRLLPSNLSSPQGALNLKL